jgi:transitional endoplasmic reticulum ATPase
MKFEQMKTSGIVARVRAMENGDRRLYLESRNGQTVTVDQQNPFKFSLGSVVLIWPDENRIEVAPDELWPEESWVGVVRLRLSDATIVDSGGRWRLLTTRNDITYHEGNTVEARDSSQVFVRVNNQIGHKAIVAS